MEVWLMMRTKYDAILIAINYKLHLDLTYVLD